MKKLLNYSFAAFLAASALFSCRQKDVVTPAVVQQSDTPNGIRKYSLTLNIVPASTQGARTQGISGATVTLTQGKDIVTKTTAADGFVTFDDLSEGTVSWYVNSSASGLALVSGQTDLAAAVAANGYFNSGNQSDQKANVAVIVKVPKLAASVSGTLVADLDFNGNTQDQPLAGATVRLQYAVGGGVQNTGTQTFYEPNFFIATAGSDGVFTFSNVPAMDNITGVTATLSAELVTTNGGQTIKFSISPLTLATGDLSSAKTSNVGFIKATSTFNNTGSFTGVFFGDFSLLDKSDFLNSATAGLGGAGGTFDPTSAENFNSSTNNGTFNFGITTPGFAGFLDYAVFGSTTIVGYVNTSNNTIAGFDYSVIADTVFAFSAIEYGQLNKNTIKSYAVYNGVDQVTYQTVTATYPAFSVNYSGVSVKLTITGGAGSYAGPTEFIATTDAAGRVNLNGLPIATYRIDATLFKTVALPNGYTKIIKFSYAKTGVGIVRNETYDNSTVELTY